MKNIQQIVWAGRLRPKFLLLTASLLGIVTAGIMPLTAGAVQVSSRSITMSDSAPSGGSIATGVGSGTNVAYTVAFNTTSTSTAIGGIVIDFCQNTPLIGDACTAPVGFNVNRATTQIYNQTGISGYSVYTSDSTNSRIILINGTAANPSGTVSFQLGNGSSNGITNPSTAATSPTFYARIYTYPTATAAEGHNSGNPSGYVDYGGIALSTANTITINAQVQESLIFCVSASLPGSNCSSLTTPAITLGHTAGGGSNKVIDSTAVDTATIYTQLSTNALSGVTVRMHINNSCGGLSSDGGTTCNIPPVNSGAATAPTSAMAAGTAGFGLSVDAGSGGTGTVTPANPYNNSGNAGYYGMDSTSVGSNVTTTFGGQVISSTAPTDNVDNTWTFGATTANTTPAGLYAANLSLIATGTF